MIRSALPLFFLLSLVACGGSDGGSPTSPSPAPTPTTFNLTGQVVNDSTGSGIAGATVTIVDGPNASRGTTTDGAGNYSLTGLQASGFTVRARAQYYNESSEGVTLTTNRIQNLRLRPIPPFSRSGVGNTVFDMPLHVRRLRIRGTYTGRSSNFVVWIGGDLEVNELLGTSWGKLTYDGLHAVVGGFTEVKLSDGVSWSMVEER